MRLPFASGFIATVLLLTVVGATQAPGPKLRIAEPPDGDYVSGPVTIRPLLDPPSTPVEKMTFFADGRLVCTVERPPFECAWNAGPPPVHPHTFRVVAYLPGGRRVSADAATKGLDWTDNAEVPTKHVIVTVLDGSKFVPGLEKKAFRLYDDEVQRPLLDHAAQAIEQRGAVRVGPAEVVQEERQRPALRGALHVPAQGHARLEAPRLGPGEEPPAQDRLPRPLLADEQPGAPAGRGHDPHSTVCVSLSVPLPAAFQYSGRS